VPDDYEILAEVGRGGRGAVYQARQRSTGRTVALKVLPTAGPLSDKDWHRQCQEAQPALDLKHPHLVPVYDLDLFGRSVVIAMEYLPGGSLYRKMAGQPQPARASAELVEQLARVLGFVHGNGLVHRDLNPANVLFAGAEAGGAFPNADAQFGLPKVTDFDVVRRLGWEPATADQTSLGPPTPYQAPEQDGGKNRQVGPPADVWALGVILYELLTGKPPFRGRTIVELLQQVRELTPVPPSRLVARVPRALESICLKCLKKQPHRRYPDGAKLAEDLRWFREGRPLSDHHRRAYDQQRFRRKE
jgi:eukaryotic-like serine/threonine-protein kinase